MIDPTLNQPWAISRDGLVTTAHIWSEAIAEGPTSLAAKHAYRAQSGERLGVRDGVGILYITGPMQKYASWVSRALGWATYDVLRRDLQAALDDPKILAIALYVDSPGGEANGCDELAAAIYGARGKKPIHSFVSGMACSGGYWLASAAEKVVVSDLAVLGSIGVAVQYERRESASGVRTVEFVSAQSPGKSFLPLRIQKMVNDLGAVFVRQVARYRGVTPETVLKKFGGGGVEIGAKAVAAGMADAVGSFEGVVDDLLRRGGTTPVRIDVRPLSAVSAAPRQEHRRPATAIADPELTPRQRAEAEGKARGQSQARARIQAIFNSIEGKRLPDRAAYYAFDTALSADEAIAAMKSGEIQASWKRAAERINP